MVFKYRPEYRENLVADTNTADTVKKRRYSDTADTDTSIDPSL